jgi:hypothetical protein
MDVFVVRLQLWRNMATDRRNLRNAERRINADMSPPEGSFRTQVLLCGGAAAPALTSASPAPTADFTELMELRARARRALLFAARYR